MDKEQTPLHIPGISESLYAGFGLRFGSLLLDLVFVLPVTLSVLFVNEFGKNVFFYSIIPHFVFGLWYSIYLPKKYGGTPGKLVAGITIVKIDGQPIGWREAILRHIVLLALSVLSSVLMSVSLMEADEETLNNLNWLERSQYLMSLSPRFFTLSTWANNIWVYSEFIVLLTNERKRALHDFIAGTVIVKTKYLDKIRETMSAERNPDSRLAGIGVGQNLQP